MCTPKPSATSNILLILLEAGAKLLLFLLRAAAKGLQLLAVGLIAAAVWAAPRLYRAIVNAAARRRATATPPGRPATAPTAARQPVAALTRRSSGLTLHDLLGNTPANSQAITRTESR